MKNEKIRTKYTQQELTAIASSVAKIKIVAECQAKINKMYNPPLHKYLWECLDEKKISVNRLARISKVSRTEINLILSGKRLFPELDTIAKLCNGFDLNQEQATALYRKAYLLPDETDDIPLSAFLMSLIKEKGMSQSEVANKSNIAPAEISKLLNNKVKHPSLNTVLCLCIGLQLSPKQSSTLLRIAHRSVDNDLVLKELLQSHYNEDIIRWNYYLKCTGRPLLGRVDSEEWQRWLDYFTKETKIVTDM